jgi:integrase/recombinase XerD
MALRVSCNLHKNEVTNRMTPSTNVQFNHYYELHCKHLRLKGLQPKTIEAYTRAIRRIGLYFDYQMDDLSHDQLLDYFYV